MDGVPKGIDIDEVKNFILLQDGVTAVHDLHIWALSTTDTALTVHLVMDPRPGDDAFLNMISDGLEHRFGIEHPTIQIEGVGSGSNCPQLDSCAT